MYTEKYREYAYWCQGVKGLIFFSNKAHVFSILLIDHRYNLGLVLQHSIKKSSLQKIG